MTTTQIKRKWSMIDNQSSWNPPLISFNTWIHTINTVEKVISPIWWWMKLCFNPGGKYMNGGTTPNSVSASNQSIWIYESKCNHCMVASVQNTYRCSHSDLFQTTETENQYRMNSSWHICTELHSMCQEWPLVCTANERLFLSEIAL